MDKEIEMKFDISFNCIIVLQSLRDGEPETGEDLFNNIISRRCDQLGVTSHLIKVKSRDEFFVAMESIREAVISKGYLPILHLEMHGSEEGFQLGNYEQVDYEEVAKYCRDINIHLKNGLIVSLASCKGAYFYQVTDIMQPAPYCGYIGPKDKIYNDELLRDYSNFYNILLFDKDPQQALIALNVHHDNYRYVFLTAAVIFDMVSQRVNTRPHKKSDAFQRLKDRAKQQYPTMNRKQARQQLRTNIHGHNRHAYLASVKRQFLML